MENQDIDIFYKKHVNGLFSYAKSRGFDRDTSMDAVHDVFYKCITRNIFGHTLNLRCYLQRMLKNQMFDLYREKQKESEISLNIEYMQMHLYINITAEDELIAAEEYEANQIKVRQMLQNISKRQREIVYLRFVHECSYKEISQTMHITVPACRKLVHKALTKLRRDVLAYNYSQKN